MLSTSRMLKNLSKLSSPRVECRGIKMFKPIDENPNLIMPKERRLPLTRQIPAEIMESGQIGPKGTKELWRMRGEEMTHNKLMLGQYGIIAIHGGALKWKHFQIMNSFTSQQLKDKEAFAMYRVDSIYKPITDHGRGKKLGGGKGKIHHYVTPVRAGRVILEVAGNLMWEDESWWLQKLARVLPFEAIAVNAELLERLNKEEQRLEEINENPYTLEWIMRNNLLDCGHTTFGPYDRKWFGKFVYKDRTLNKKWNTIRNSPYVHGT